MRRFPEFNPLMSHIFLERVNFLDRSQFWSEQLHREYQLKCLKYLVFSVEKYVPFYRKFMNKNNISWKDIHDIEDLSIFPLIDKQTVSEQAVEFISDLCNKKNLYFRSTGGSTGKQLCVYMDFDFLCKDKANTEFYMNVLGLDIFNYRSARIYGDRIDSRYLIKNKYWYIQEKRKLVMSCYHIDSSTFKDYLRKLDSFSPDYIHTRASAIYPLAKLMIINKKYLKKVIKFIICDGEYITQHQREVIERAFRGKLINIYGHTEGCAVGLTCTRSNLLHFIPEVGITELLDASGKKVHKDGGKGELVVTGFNNSVFPLIRYKTGDIAINSTDRCPCNRSYRMFKSIEGRKQDYVVSQKNSLVPLAPAVFNYNDMDWSKVKEFKVVQKKIGFLEIFIVPESLSNMNNVNFIGKIKSDMEKIFGGLFNIEIFTVSQLQRSSIGKFRYLEQRLEIDSFFSESRII